jgi:O-antigen/teichoic acid export membrane protein
MSLHKRLASQSSILFAVRLFGAGLVFIAQALIARHWGPTLLGEYLLVIATVNLVAMVMPLGFQTIATYFAAEYRARGERANLKLFLVWAYGHVAVVFAAFLLLGLPILHILGQGRGSLAEHFVQVAIMSLAYALIYISGSLLVGLKRPYAGFFTDGLFRPLLVLGAFLINLDIVNPDLAYTSMLWVFALSHLSIAVIHFIYVLLTIRSIPDEKPAEKTEIKRWWRFALPWVLISIALDFFFDIDLLLLSQILSREELAIFGVCARIFALISFGVVAVYAVTMPDMFESEAQDDREAFKRKVGDANFVAACLSVVLFIGVLIGAPFALLLFGESFTVGAVPLAILSLALVVRSVMGPASLVLSIHDKPYASLPSVALSIVTLVVGNALLVPPFGLVGAALSALISITIWSVGLWYIALRQAKMDVSVMQWFRNRRAAAGTGAN